MPLLEFLNIFRPSKTIRYSEAQGITPDARGIPMAFLSSDVDCVACGACAKVCSTQAIQIQGTQTLDIDYGRCTQCGLCVDACSAGLIKNSHFVDVFATTREEFKVKFRAGQAPETQSGKTREDVEAFRRLTKKNGFNYREVAASGNNTVECELNASANYAFDSESIGVRSVASPKHADAVVFSGPVGPGMAGPLQTAWACMPSPKALIACGTEAISGGLYERGPLPAEPLLYVAGDPPRPDVIQRAFLLLMGRFSMAFSEKFVRVYNSQKDLRNKT